MSKIELILIGGPSDGRTWLVGNHGVFQVPDPRPAEREPITAANLKARMSERITATLYRRHRIMVEKTFVEYATPASYPEFDALWLWQKLIDGYRRAIK